MIKILGVPLSVHTRKAIVAARYKGLAHKVEPVFPFDPPENWRKLSPTGLIPAIEHDGFDLADSTAICLYFDKISPDRPLVPEDARDAGVCHFINAYAGDALFRNVVHTLFFERVLKPAVMQQPTDQALVDAILADKAPGVFDVLQAHVEQGHLGGEATTLADIAVISNLINFSYLGYRLSSHPALEAYFRRMVDRPEFLGAIKDERPFVEQMSLDDGFLATA